MGIVPLSFKPPRRSRRDVTLPNSSQNAQAIAARARGIEALADGGAADGTQIDDQHDPVVGRGGAAVVKVGAVVQRDGEAIVDIAKADAVLVDLARLQIVARLSQQAAVLGELELDLPGYALAPLQESDFRLRIVVSVERGELPAIEIRAGLDFDPADRE